MSERQSVSICSALRPKLSLTGASDSKGSKVTRQRPPSLLAQAQILKVSASQSVPGNEPCSAQRSDVLGEPLLE